jgi:NADPH:quinone reductase-like Zn-dependent oxidoreductase
MKAVVYENYGSPEVLELREVAKPAPRDNEILVRVRATTVTVADSRMRGFRVPLAYWLPARITLGFRKPKTPVLGTELAGEVEAVGKAVRRFKPGDPVFASTFYNGFGAYAEYKCLPEDTVVALKPANATYAEAAAVPLGARTALHYLRKANVRRGQKVLVYGASGSVGTYAVQLAKHMGVEVTAVCSGPNLALLRALGADRVIDYTLEEFSSGGPVYDVVFEAVDKSSFAACARALKPDGVYVNISIPFPSPRMMWTRLTTRQKLILGENVPRQAEDLAFLKELVEAGKLRPVIDRVYPLERIVEAHRYVDKGHKRGNVAITLGVAQSPA